MVSKQALVFGASGISGWAIVRECVLSGEFNRTVAITKRPLEALAFLLTEDKTKTIEVLSGVDLTKDVDSVIQRVKAIEDIDKITHVYYTAYAGHGSDFQALKATNVDLLSTTIQATISLCPKLAFFTLQTGAKAYGPEFYGQPGLPFNPPLKESAPRIPEPYASNIFYYPQYDLLAEHAANSTQKFGFCEIRPGVVVGFAPRGNAMGFAQCLGLFLAIYRSVKGEGAEVVFPGDETVWKTKHSDTSQDVLAKFHVYASLHRNKVHGQAFNVADEETITWEGVWVGICEWFGLKGVGPRKESGGEALGTEWVMGKKDMWGEWIKENGLQEGVLESSTWWMMSWVLGSASFDWDYDLSASGCSGFQWEKSAVKGYLRTFERMRAVKMIPP